MIHTLLICFVVISSANSSVRRLLSGLNDSASASEWRSSWNSDRNDSSSSEDDEFITTDILDDNDTIPYRSHHGHHHDNQSSRLFSRWNSRRKLLGDGERRGGRGRLGRGAVRGNADNVVLPTTLALDDNRLGLGLGLTLDDVLGNDALGLDDLLGLNDRLGLDDLLGLASTDLLDGRLSRLATARRLQRQAAASMNSAI